MYPSFSKECSNHSFHFSSKIIFNHLSAALTIVRLIKVQWIWSDEKLSNLVPALIGWTHWTIIIQNSYYTYIIYWNDFFLIISVNSQQQPTIKYFIFNTLNRGQHNKNTCTCIHSYLSITSASRRYSDVDYSHERDWIWFTGYHSQRKEGWG